MVTLKTSASGIFKIWNTEDTYRGLTLRCIHKCCADGCRENHVSESLLLENSRSGLRSVECSVDVDVHDLLEFLRGVLLGGMLGANAGVGQNHIQSAKVLSDLINRFGDFF